MDLHLNGDTYTDTVHKTKHMHIFMCLELMDGHVFGYGRPRVNSLVWIMLILAGFGERMPNQLRLVRSGSNQFHLLAARLHLVVISKTKWKLRGPVVIICFYGNSYSGVCFSRIRTRLMGDLLEIGTSCKKLK